MRRLPLLLLALLPSQLCAFPVPALEWNPETYACVKAEGAVLIDGRLDEADWSRAEWTADFTDIEGPPRPAPGLGTRAKMLWDDAFFYVAGEMEEPHLWATYRERDSVIYHENDFEVFIDPDGDNHLYYELEINVLGTEWDLLLVRPYRDGGPAIHGWDIAGLKTAVKARGSINNPADRDEGWTVEIAFPWAALAEAAGTACPPSPGDRWRVNFSRVEYDLDSGPDGYVKRIGASGKPLPEHNWVWSPQGLIAMHYPEMWGIVEFRDKPGGPRVGLSAADLARRRLCELYYDQRRRFEEAGEWSGRPETVSGAALHRTPSGFEIVLRDAEGAEHHIDETGRLW